MVKLRFWFAKEFHLIEKAVPKLENSNTLSE